MLNKINILKNILITNNSEEIKFLKKKNIKFDVFTSSFNVLEFCKDENLKAKLLDELVLEKDFFKLSKLSSKFEKDLFIKLNQKKDIFPAELNEAIRMPNFYLINTTIYFSLILSNLIKNQNYSIYIFKNNGFENENPMHPGYKRFDNIFSLLLEYSKIKNVILLDKLDLKNNLNTKNKKNELIKIIFKIFYNSPSSFVFKLWRNKFIYPIFKTIANFLNFEKIYLYDSFESNEIMQEIFLEILKKRKIYIKLEKLNFNFKQPNNNYAFYNELLNISKKINLFSKFNIEKHIFNSAIYLILTKISHVYAVYQFNKKNLFSYFDIKFHHLKPHDKIFTRGYFRTSEIIMYSYLINKNVITTSFEHGITHGFANVSKIISEYYALKYSQNAVYLCPISTTYLNFKNQKQYFSGIPDIFNQNFLKKFINKNLLKSLLRLGDDKIILFAPFPEINNFILGPDYPRDLNLKENLKLIEYFCKKYKDHKIILKLYPHDRFINNFNYEKFVQKYKNLKIIKNIDLRYLTHIAELIFTTLPTSTIGIMYKSNVKGYYLEYSWNKIYRKSEEKKINLKSLNKTHNIKSFKELNLKWNTKFIEKII